MIRIFIDENNPDTARRIADLQEQFVIDHKTNLLDVLKMLSAPETIVNGPSRDNGEAMDEAVPVRNALSQWGDLSKLPKGVLTVSDTGTKLTVSAANQYDKAELNTKSEVVPPRETWTSTNTIQQLNVTSY